MAQPPPPGQARGSATIFRGRGAPPGSVPSAHSQTRALPVLCSLRSFASCPPLLTHRIVGFRRHARICYFCHSTAATILVLRRQAITRKVVFRRRLPRPSPVFAPRALRALRRAAFPRPRRFYAATENNATMVMVIGHYAIYGGMQMDNSILQTLMSDGLFSVAVAAYLLVRMESKIGELTKAVTELKIALEQHKEQANG